MNKNHIKKIIWTNKIFFHAMKLIKRIACSCLGTILYLFSFGNKHKVRSKPLILIWYLSGTEANVVTLMITALSCSHKLSASCHAKLEYILPKKMLSARGMDADVKNWTVACCLSEGSRLLEYSISSSNKEKVNNKKSPQSHFMDFQKANSQQCFVLLSQRDPANPPTFKEKEYERTSRG